MPETAVVTLLFTDLVGSTELAQRLGEDGAEVLRREHTQVLRDAIAATGGSEVKHMGDGLMVVFSSPSEAARCAVAMQQGVEKHNRRLPEALGLRVGIHVGEVTKDEDDYFGSAVVVAERLCKRAEGGQSYTSDVFRALVGTRGGHVFKEVGPLDLKGIDEPVVACELYWEPESGDRVPFPTGFPQADRLLFVGRGGERERLFGAWKRAIAGERALAFIAGEPGIGKTRLATELALDAHAAGATVLFGRCDEDLGVPYQPFAESLRHYVAYCGLDELTEHVARHGGELARLSSELHVRLPDAPQPAAADAADPQADRDADRIRLFEAATALLLGATLRAPVLVVLDDLHWASRPTLLLLRHLLRATEGARLLIVGTYRDTDLARTHPFAEILADLRREIEVERVSLSGLDEDGVAAFVEAASGQKIDEAMRSLVRAVCAETEGNPFFVGQVMRHLAESGAVYQKDGRWTYDVPVDRLGIPEGVREVVGRRLSRLSEAANRSLAVASVVGAEFDLAVVELVPEAAEAGDVLDALDEAVAARIVDEVTGEPGRFRFTHTLVRQTLYEELTSARRVRLHERVGDAIEKTYLRDIEPQLAVLARHYGEAARSGGVAKAASYAIRAGQNALTRAAYEEAIEVARRGLQVVDLDAEPHPLERVDLLLIVARAHMALVEVDSMREACLQAVELARAAGSAHRLAKAAWNFSFAPIGVQDEAIALCEEALVGLEQDDVGLRALMLTTLVWLRSIFGRAIGLKELSRDALELARSADDPQNNWFSPFVRSWVLREAVGSEALSQDEELALADEVVAMGERARDAQIISYGYRLKGVTRLRLGDRAGYDEDFNFSGGLLDRHGDTFESAISDGSELTEALLDGRLDDAELFVSKLATSWGTNVFMAVGYAVRLGAVRFEQGRFDEHLPLALGQMQILPFAPGWKSVAAFGLLKAGRPDEARAYLDELAAADFHEIRIGTAQTSAPAFLAYVCAELEDARYAPGLYDLLRPHAGALVTVADALACLGAADRFLGIYAALSGDVARADGHFVAALDLETRLGSRPLLARTQYWWARMRPDRDESVALLDEAVSTAAGAGMRELEQSARELYTRLALG